jgi:G patch domain/KOW motif-containing protein
VEAVDGAGIDKFETAAHDTATAQGDVTYGLIQRQRPDGAGPSATGGGGRGRDREAILDREADVLKSDLADLPPEASIEAYEAMPVEAFGEALMRGMGWSEGRAVGRTAREEVLAKELVRRPQRLGLGAAPVPELPKKKVARPGERGDGA